MFDIVEWSNVFIQSAGIPGIFIISLISAGSIFFFPVADIVFIPWAVSDSVGLNATQVGLAAGLAAALGELVAYAIGRLSNNLTKLRKRMVRTRKGLPAHTLYFVGGRRIKRHTDPEDWISRYGFWAIPVFAFTPLPMDLLGLAMGFLRYNVLKFLLGTLIGKIPRCFLLAYGFIFFRIPPLLILVGLVALGVVMIACKRIRL